MGKPSAPTIGYWYRPAFHIAIAPKTIDKVLAIAGGDKIAWTGELSASGTIHVDAPNLWGGEKDQGGMVGDVDFMFGEATQVPNSYLVGVFGDKTAAWRGCTTYAWKGGRYGAMNPYPQPMSVKFIATKAGWDNGCWYPEKAEIPLIDGFVQMLGTGWEYQIESFSEPNSVWNNFTVPTSGWLQGGELPFATPELGSGAYWTMKRSNIWLRRQMHVNAIGLTLNIGADNGCLVWVDGVNVGSSNPTNTPIPSNHLNPVSFTFAATGTVEVIVKAFAEINAVDDSGNLVDMSFTGTPLIAFNPAHAFYETLIDSEMGREPVENIADASFRAGADIFYAAGFGINTRRDPANENLEDYWTRLGKMCACSISRSVADGKWYLDLAWGIYDFDSLPIITDDDILDFKSAPTTQDEAVNSVSVKYFDTEKRANVLTPAVRSSALVAAYGTIHQTNEYLELPTGDLAARVATRDMLASTTPTRAFDLVCKPTIYALRPNQYFRLQAPKRGIADMVCLVGEKEGGSLKSGAIKLRATQDIYSMPDAAFVQVEPGVDTRPPQTPNAIALERVFEAPYVKVAGSLARADLDAVPTDVGFAVAVAAAPASELDFTMMVDAGAGYDEAGRGEWAATATVNETAAKGDTDFTLAAGKRLDQVLVGMGALWDDELVRVNAIDAGAGTISLGRGCADTVPVTHAADARLWFYDVGMAYDSTEYTDGETVAVKLLPNTGSQQLPIGSATPLSLTFDQRQSRPYPPGKVKIDAVAWPATESGSFVVTWAHRDRIGQADQLVDTTAASIGPEATTRYALRFYNDSTNALLVEKLDIDGATATVNLAASATVRMELWSISALGDSWQKHVHVFAYTSTGGANTITAATYAAPTWVIDGNGG